MADEVAKATVRIEPDTEGFAEELDAKVEAATQPRDARGRFVKIGVDVDTAAATAKLAALDEEVKKVNRDGDDLSAKFKELSSGGVAPLAIGIAALIPLLPVAAGGVAALGGSLAAAGAAGIGLGAVVETNIKAATTAYQQLQAAQLAVDTATSKNSLNDALIKQKALVDSLSPSTIALGDSLHSLTNEWKGFSNAFIPDTNVLVTGISKLATDSLPKLQPLIQNTFGVANTLIKDLDNSVNSTGGKTFFSWLSVEGPRDLQGFATGLGSIGSGFAHLMQDFTPVETQLVDGFDHIAASFDKWTSNTDTNAGFQKFLTTVEKDGPQVVHTIGQIADAAGHIAAGLAPLLPYELGFINFITSVIINHPALDVALAAMFTGFEALKIVGTITGPIGTLVGVAKAGAVWLFGFSAAEDAVGASAAGATGKVVALDVAMDGAAGKAKGLMGLLGISSFAELASVAGVVGGLGAVIAGGSWIAAHVGPGSYSDSGRATPEDVKNAQALTGNEWAGMGPDISGGQPTTILPGGIAVPTDSLPAGSAGTHIPGSYTQNLAQSNSHDAVNNIVGGNNTPMLPPGSISGAPYVPPKNAGNNPVLPLNPTGGGSAAATLAANNAAAYAQTLGLNIMASLAAGVTTGTNPLTQAFGNLNQKLTGQAQTLGTALESAFNSTLAYGQAAAASMKSNLLNSPTLGSQTSIFMDAQGHSTTSFIASGPNAQFGLQQTLAADKHFAGDISKLRQLGLSGDLVDQLVQGGPQQSVGIADSILGDPSQIKQLNSLNSQINSTANTYGIQQAQAQSLAQVVTLFQQLIALERTAPGVIVAGINAGLSSVVGGGGKTAQLKAATTPSKGVLARGI